MYPCIIVLLASSVLFQPKTAFPRAAAPAAAEEATSSPGAGAVAPLTAGTGPCPP